MPNVFKVTEVKTYTVRDGVASFFRNVSVVTTNNSKECQHTSLDGADAWIYDRISPGDTVEYYQNHDGTLTCAYTYEEFLKSVHHIHLWELGRG